MSAVLKEIPKNRPNEEWVAELEQALERARSGEVHGGALVEDKGTHVRQYTTGLKNKWEFMGHLHNIISTLCNPNA